MLNCSQNRNQYFNVDIICSLQLKFNELTLMEEERLSDVKKVHKSMGRPKKQLEAEERAKREIANSNERRRMQSINDGFSCLRQILRQHNNIEKHSKAAILHQSAGYIRKLEQDINFVDNYQKQRTNQQKNDSEESVEERPDKDEDTEEDTSFVSPNKSNLLNFCALTNKLQVY